MNSKSKIFDSLIESFENDDLREYAKGLIETIPNYFWDVGASSTGKYHPQYALGDLGLARHTCALVRIMNHILNLDCVQEDFNSRERDLLRIAGIMHDTRKSGNDDDYKKSKYTRFEHPLLAAQVIRNTVGISAEEIELIANTIESHMGQWNTDKRSSVTLPTPKNKYQKLLHICDYLASRKDIEVMFTGEFAKESSAQTPEVKMEEYVMPFGKYKGELLINIAKDHKDYLEWMNAKLDMKEPMNSFVKKLLAP